MPVRFKGFIMAAMTATLLSLAACQTTQPAPPVAAAQTAAPPVARTPTRVARPRRTDPCKTTTSDLTPDRKTELFRQFAAMQDGATDPETAPPPPHPSPIAACRQAAR